MEYDCPQSLHRNRSGSTSESVDSPTVPSKLFFVNNNYDKKRIFLSLQMGGQLKMLGESFWAERTVIIARTRFKIPGRASLMACQMSVELRLGAKFARTIWTFESEFT